MVAVESMGLVAWLGVLCSEIWGVFWGGGVEMMRVEGSEKCTWRLV